MSPGSHMASGSRFFSPLSLEDYSLLYVICHLESFPTSLLALLPSKLRQRLLLSLPALDVCRLEHHSGFAQSLDLNSVWRDLFRARQGGLAGMDRLLGDLEADECRWKDEYFRLVLGLALHYFADANSSAVSSMHVNLFYDLLLTVRSPLGVDQWPWLDCTLFYSTSMIQGGMLVRLRNIIRLPSSSSEAVRMIVDNCHYSPTAVLFILDDFIYSDLWEEQDEARCSLLKQLLSKVEIVRFVSENRLSRCRMTAELPHFILSLILSSDSPVLHSLVVSDCLCSDMERIISSCAPLFSSTDSGPSYYGLRNLMLSPRVVFRNSTFHSVCAGFLADMLEHQTALSSISMSSFNPCRRRETPAEGFARLYCALSSLVKRPQLGTLGLGMFTLPFSALQDMLFKFFMTENADTHGAVLGGLSLIGEIGAAHCHPGLVSMTNTALDSKQCSLMEMDIPRVLSQWLFSCRRLRFKMLELSALTFDDCSPLEMIAKHPDFEARELVFSQLHIPDTPAVHSAITTLLSKACLERFTLKYQDTSFRGITLGLLTHITAGLRKQKEVGKLQYLDISGMHFTHEDVDTVELFFETLAQLPQVESLELILSSNGFLSRQFGVMGRAWRLSSSGRRLKVLDVQNSVGGLGSMSYEDAEFHLRGVATNLLL